MSSLRKCLRTQLSLYPTGNDSATLSVSLGQGSVFTFPGMPLIVNQTAIAMGTSLAIGVQVIVPSGPAQEFTSWAVTAGPFFAEPAGSTPTIPASTNGMMITMPGYVNRQDQQLPCNQRLLPANRNISTPPAGFTIGAYCWRE